MADKTVKKRVKHVLTEKETAEINAVVSQKSIELEEREEEKKRVSSICGGLSAEISEKLKAIKDGFDFREMDCPVEYDYKKGKKKVLHPETAEILETLDIPENERQIPLPFAGGKAVKAKKKEDEDADPDSGPFKKCK